MIGYFKKNWKIIVFSAVILLAVFLRVFHFHDWLFFKMDQARDALLAKQALENGPGWLPLLGPKAGGTHLNLGPAFYYFQHLATFLFQSARPSVLAYPDLLFSILSIPLFYFFLKKYFSRDWSLVLSALYAVCFLGIEYSRFAWNPNSLVFFNLLYFYSLLNIFDSPRTTENNQSLLNKNITSSKESVVRGKRVKYRLRWIIAAALSFAVSTQLHFLSFATLPVITIIFVLFNRKEIKKYLGWKSALIFIAIILFVYLPVFLNEIITHGKNTSAFIAAVKSKPSHHSLWKNILRDFRYFGQNWFLILTGWISKKGSIRPAIIAWLGVLLPGLFLGIKFFRGEKDSLKKKFILISILWLAAYFLIYIPVAYQIRPRFFLPLLALPFIFIGYLAKYFWEKNSKIWKAGAIAALAIILIGNLYGTYLWFKEIKSAQKRGVYPKRTIILKARDGIVLWHLERAAEYIKKDCRLPVVYYAASAEYKYPIRYLLNLRNITGVSLKNFNPSQNGCFYAFVLTRSQKGVDSGIKEKFEVFGQEKIGALSLYKLNPGEEFLNNPNTKKEKPEEKRVFWRDIAR